MTTSYSFTTPMASFSATDHPISRNRNQHDENPSSASSNQGSFHSLPPSSNPKRQRRSSSIMLQTIRTDNANIQSTTADYRNDDEEHRLGLYYDSNRLKQEKLLLFANVFRLLVIFILGPVIYFIV